ncbi:hypothetical protein WAI453_010775 [Rhynchosporium graminicola]
MSDTLNLAPPAAAISHVPAHHMKLRRVACSCVPFSFAGGRQRMQMQMQMQTDAFGPFKIPEEASDQLQPPETGSRVSGIVPKDWGFALSSLSTVRRCMGDGEIVACFPAWKW